ncbi:MAG: TonB-dependent receptor [Cyclobacteriaceae bacterium]|nr:TonB-dependent receptor [Cyclobacteriaceae bacterium]
MKTCLLSLLGICLLALPAGAQTPFLDSIGRPDYVAWEYQLDEVVVEGDHTDMYNTALRYYKSDPLSSSDEVMEKLAGIWAIKRGNYALEPTLRGLSAGQINVTIDGMRMLGACTDKMDPITSYVEPNNLQEIHARPGANGFQSGSTVGGSFDMQIKRPSLSDENPWTGSFGSRFLSANNGLEALFNTSYFDQKRLAIRLSASYRKGENYRAGGGEIIDNSSYNKVNYAASATLLQKDGGQINLSYIGDNAWDIGYPALVMDVSSARAHIVGLSYDKPFHGGKFNYLTSKVYYNHVDHVMDDTGRDVVMHMDMPGNTSTFGAYATGYYAFGDKFSGEMKGDFYHSAAYAEMTMYPDESSPMFMLTWPDIQRNVAGYYNRTTWKINKFSSATGGLRLEANKAAMKSELGERQFSVFNYGTPTGGKILVNANLGFEHIFRQYFTARASAAFGQRMPNESEQFGFYLYSAYDGYDYVGKTTLDPEQSMQGEIALRFEKDKISIAITGFYYHFTQYIMGIYDPSLSPMTIGAQGVKVYDNLDNAQLAGMESQIGLSIGRLDILNISKAVYGKTVDDEPLPLIPPFKNNLNLALHAGTSWHIYGEVEASTAQRRINEAFGESDSPAYCIANARLEKTFRRGHASLRLSAAVDNIFDTNYFEHLDWGNIPRMGRNIQFSVFVSY